MFSDMILESFKKMKQEQELEEYTKSVESLIKATIKAGFTEKEAKELVKEIILRSIK